MWTSKPNVLELTSNQQEEYEAGYMIGYMNYTPICIEPDSIFEDGFLDGRKDREIDSQVEGCTETDM